jgi:hypothetical protein
MKKADQKIGLAREGMKRCQSIDSLSRFFSRIAFPMPLTSSNSSTEVKALAAVFLRLRC